MEEFLLSQVAEMYYLRGLKQATIARHFGVSKMQVSRLLQKARDVGIVRIDVRYPGTLPRDERAAEELSRSFGLRDALVLQVEAEADNSFSYGAARYVSSLVQPGTILGVGWGRTVSAVAGALPERADATVGVVQIVGAFGASASETPYDASKLFAERLGARLWALHAPAFLESRETRDRLMQEPSVRSTLEVAAKANYALVGIGTADQHTSTFHHAGYLTSAEIQDLIANGAVGDVLGHYVDARGKEIEHRLSRNFVGLSLAGFRQVPTKVAVARGRHKASAIAGVLRSGAIDVLVTDAATAADVLHLGGGRTDRRAAATAKG